MNNLPKNVDYDSRWFDELTHAGELDDSNWMQAFVQVSRQEKARFLSNEVENPRLRCKFTLENSESIAWLQKTLTELESEENVVVRELYEEKINRQIIRLEMYGDTKEGDDAAFFEKSKSLYGKPKKRYFAYIAKRLKEKLETEGGNIPAVSARRLEQVCAKIDTSSVTITADVLPPLPEEESSDVVSSKQAASIFEEALNRYGIDGWQVEVDTANIRKIFSVSVGTKTIFVPGDTLLHSRPKPTTELHVRAVAEHEVGVHVRRSHQGSQQPLYLLAVGLSQYLPGEEGLASYVQQQIEGTTEFYGFDRYLAASLAVGMDGEERDFREVFLLMRDYYLLQLIHDDTALESATNAAWEVCIRIFRGTSGKATGQIYTRDISYFEGNIKMWDLIIEKPHVFEELFVGKFNPLMKAEVDALQALGILSQW